MRRIIFIILILWSCNAIAQNKFLEVFADSSSVYFNKVKNSSDGGFLICGTDFAYNSYFVKTDSSGNVEFCKIIEMTSLYEFLEIDNGYILIGRVNSNKFILKLDLDGNPISNFYLNMPLSVSFNNIQYHDQHYYITGYERYIYGMIVIKCDTSGSIVWCKNFFNSNIWDSGNYIFTPDNSFYCVGDVYDSLTMNTKLFAVKIDSSGNPLWKKKFDFRSFVPDVCLNNSTGGIIISNTISGNSHYIPIILSLDSNGVILWNKTYHDNLQKTIFRDIEPTSDGGFIMAGETYASSANQHILLSKIDGSGNVLWSQEYNGVPPNFHNGNSVCQSSDNGYAIVGNTNGFPSGTSTLGFILKTDSLGDLGCYQQALNLTTSTMQFTEDTLNLHSGNFTVTRTSIVSPVMTDGLGTFICSSTLNILEETNQSILFYPNPVSSSASLRIKNFNSDKYLLIVSDVLGNILMTNSIQEEITLIDFSNYSNGIYFYNLRNSEQNTNGSFVVVH